MLKSGDAAVARASSTLASCTRRGLEFIRSREVATRRSLSVSSMSSAYWSGNSSSGGVGACRVASGLGRAVSAHADGGTPAGLTNGVENRSGDEAIGISMIPLGKLEGFSKWRTYWFVISMMTS